MIGGIARLARWELFKIRRRWMLWVLLIFAILFGQLVVWGQHSAYQDLVRTGGQLTIPEVESERDGPRRTVACSDLLSGDPARLPEEVDGQVLQGLTAQCRGLSAVLPERIESAYRAFTLPGSLESALNILETLGLILMAILTASAIGIDYGTGTLRAVLAQGTGRWPYLLAKLFTLASLALAGLIVTLLTVAASSAAATQMAGAAPAAAGGTPVTWGDVGVALWRSWISLLPYMALVAFVTVLARSSAAGMAIGLGYYFAEQILIALLMGLFTWFETVADFLLVRNISAWQGGGDDGGGGFSGGTLPDPTQALIVLALYAVVFWAGAFWLFEKRDVAGATGAG